MGDERALPTGTLTLVLGDVEGSTVGWEDDAESMLGEIRSFYATVADLVAAHGGVRPEEQGEGDSFVAAFGRARAAVDFAVALQRSLAADARHRVRIGVHTGDVELRDSANYAGPTLNRCARIRNLGHGGQTLVSQVTADIVADDLPDGTALRDLGAHQLRDLARAERVHQLDHTDLRTEFPPLRGTGSRAPNLPTHAEPLIGRVRELADVATLLGVHRLVTVTGAGGCGKTRLVLELAAEMADEFADGVWWVDLAPVATPARVRTATISALHIQQSGADEIASLTQALGDSSMLLVLDNCEHVVDEAAKLARALLQRCPHVRVAVTSREPLAIADEAVYRVPSMSVPEVRSTGANETVLADSDAAALFVERAIQAAPSFTVAGQEDAVAAICRRLDGIPLAIELAAARVRMMAPAQIADALQDRFRLLTGGDRTALPRQRTLEGSVEWSYDLLPHDARTVLARLSVFAGSFTLDSAEDVCEGGSVERRHVLDLLTTLVDRSLVQTEPGRDGTRRYRLLETLRIYARERLIQSGETAETRDRHLAHFKELARRASADVRSPDRMALAIRLGLERDNLRAAMDWAGTTDRGDDVLAMASIQLWISVGLFEETLNRVRDWVDDCDDPRLRIRALSCASSCYMLLGDYRGALRHAELAVEAGRELEERGPGLAVALGWLGWTQAWIGVPAEIARPHLIEAEELCEQLELPSARVNAAYMRGQLEAFQADIHDGIERLTRAVDLAAEESVPEAMFCHVFLSAHQMLAGEFDDAYESSVAARDLGALLSIPAFTSLATSQMGFIEIYRGDLVAAEHHLRTGTGLARRHGLQLFESIGTSWTGILEFAAGDDDAALEVLRSAVDDFEDYGSNYNTLIVLAFVIRAEVRAGALDAAAASVARARRLAAAHRFPGKEAECEVAAARLSLALDDPVAATETVHRGLDLATGIGAVAVEVEGLEVLAAIGASSDAERSVRLVGAIEAARSQMHWAPFASEVDAWTELVGQLRDELGDGFDDLVAEGRMLSIEDAVSLARRGRGRQRRATTGWAALTPTELQVVEHVAHGMTNKQVAGALFVSVNTVKTHLSHVFDKLGVSNRSELTARAMRERDRQDQDGRGPR